MSASIKLPVRYWAEGGRAGVLVHREVARVVCAEHGVVETQLRWVTLVRFFGPQAEAMAKSLAEVVAWDMLRRAGGAG